MHSREAHLCYVLISSWNCLGWASRSLRRDGGHPGQSSTRMIVSSQHQKYSKVIKGVIAYPCGIFPPIDTRGVPLERTESCDECCSWEGWKSLPGGGGLFGSMNLTDIKIRPNDDALNIVKYEPSEGWLEVRVWIQDARDISSHRHDT